MLPTFDTLAFEKSTALKDKERNGKLNDAQQIRLLFSLCNKVKLIFEHLTLLIWKATDGRWDQTLDLLSSGAWETKDQSK